MKRGLLYYPMFVNEFDDDPNVMAMSLAAVGLYLLALNESWKRGSIPSNLDDLARQIRRRPAEVRKVWRDIERCWIPSGEGRLVNPRQEIERAIAAEKSSKARESARLKHGGNDANARANAPPKAHANAHANGGAKALLSKIQDPEKELIHPSVQSSGVEATPGRTDGYEAEFRQIVLKAGGWSTIPDEIVEKISVRAIKHGAEATRAAAVFLEVYHRSSAKRMDGDGVGYLLVAFENELRAPRTRETSALRRIPTPSAGAA